LGLAAAGLWVDAWVAAHACLGQRRWVVVGRAARQVLPNVTTCLAVAVWPDHLGATWGGLAGLVFGGLLLLRWGSLPTAPSWTQLASTLRFHSNGLGASMLLGLMNAVWLNGLLPLLDRLGLHTLAGQYSLVQRLVGAPLNAVAMGVSAVLLQATDSLHQSSRRLWLTALALFAIAFCVALGVGLVLFVQPWWPVPSHWLLEKNLFLAVAFFSASSFAVGTLSVVAIRLRDEWFLAAWQALALVAWGGLLWLLPSERAFTAMLLTGGAAYWLLMLRWTRRAGVQA
jgi:hypothetical protein